MPCPMRQGSRPASHLSFLYMAPTNLMAGSYSESSTPRQSLASHHRQLTLAKDNVCLYRGTKEERKGRLVLSSSFLA
eukprot:4528251-Amphidinium_carterae.1